MLKGTWIEATGQRWKFYVVFGLLGLSILLFVALLIGRERATAETGAWMLLGLFILMLAFVFWTLFSFSCPHCQARPIWRVLRSLPQDESVYVAFFMLSHCPVCNHSFH